MAQCHAFRGSGTTGILYGVEDKLASFFDAVCSRSPVDGLTHRFYRYPARFSPQFARAAIVAFTEPGDTVLDPFMGGGTTVVEALALGRRCIGSDLNPLAKFVARAKTTPISKADAKALSAWGDYLVQSANLRSDIPRHTDWAAYQRNLPWWLRKTLEMALNSIESLATERQRQFGRCSLLKTAQWALDCRSEIPSKLQFLSVHRDNLQNMIDSTLGFRARLREVSEAFPSHVWRHRRLLTRTAAGIDRDRRIPVDWLPPKLVLTSPPYFGVHIRYHRWQVQGRRETPAPYWLAGCTDGHGEAYYTFGDRKRKDIDIYLQFLRDSFTSITALLDKHSVVVQLVGFSNPGTQLRAYLEIVRDVGLEEIDIKELTKQDNRIWRTVPSRKWYADLNGNLSTSKEVLLIHRKASP